MSVPFATTIHCTILLLAKKYKLSEGMWASLYTSTDPDFAEVLATMIYEAAIA
ncbi:MAG: hypothetical protein QHD01_17010 [Bradyrhizobium sp.]|uniref:hypothetical protein n=1 Tax=Bradyrhizobium sp. TaxID=376 RepID=UPI0029A784B8|nr:hypothetical protein [Bradyrhizobium sp.]MDX3968282.1 hypothetical protein [Bradyrhizobium sp.]